MALVAVAVLTAARLLCVRARRVFEEEGGALLGELVGVGLQAVGAGQLQELLSELSRVSLPGRNTHNRVSEAITAKTFTLNLSWFPISSATLLV